MICTSTTSYLKKKWLIPAPPLTRSPAWPTNSPPEIVAHLLINRNITDPAQAAAFSNRAFATSTAPPHPQHGLCAARIAAAVRAGEKITLYGDYDVDGITGTACSGTCLPRRR